MKFTKNYTCNTCIQKCDAYPMLVKSGKDVIAGNKMLGQFKKHDIICKQGSETTHVLFLIKGSAKLYIEGLNNRNIILYILKPKSYIGLLSFFESPIYSYSVAALEETEVCFIELPLIQKLYIENHELLLSLNKAFSKSVANIMKKIVSLNQKQIRGRIAENIIYLSELNSSHEFHLGLSRKEFGEMSGISEENTVRLLSEFAKEKIISIKGRDIDILDMPLLKKISEVG